MYFSVQFIPVDGACNRYVVECFRLCTRTRGCMGSADDMLYES